MRMMPKMKMMPKMNLKENMEVASRVKYAVITMRLIPSVWPQGE